MVIDEKTNELFEGLVDSIYELKKQDKSTLHLEQEIENKINEIYSLSETEIALITLPENADGKGLLDIIPRSALVNP
jgi:hypothetical protein